MKLWHWTSRHHLPKILRDGYLDLTESNLIAPGDLTRSDVPVCWFLDVPLLGNSPHGLTGSMVDKSEIRIAVDVPHAWSRAWLPWAEALGIERSWLDALVNVGGGRQAAERWWVTTRRVDKSLWLAVENAYSGEKYHFTGSDARESSAYGVARSVGTCTCVCASGGFCGGCGHAGCGRR